MSKRITKQLEAAGFDFAVAQATEPEIKAGAACGQLSIITKKAPTYESIRLWVRCNFNAEVQSCHIAHALKKLGYPIKRAVNRKGEGRVKPCPKAMFGYIEDAVRNLS